MHVKRLMGTSWLVYDDGRGILIDAGLRTYERALLKKVSDLGIDIPLIFLTHTHYDHTGCAEALRKATGANVIVSEKEAAFLRSGHTPVPKGTGVFQRRNQPGSPCSAIRQAGTLCARHTGDY